MDDRIRDLIFQAVDGTISEEDFDRLQDAIEESTEVRDTYLRAVGLWETLGEMSAEGGETGASHGSINKAARTGPPARTRVFGQWLVVAVALLLVAGLAFWFGRRNSPDQVAAAPDGGERTDGGESLIPGHATLRRTANLTWPDGTIVYREGDVLPDGPLRFDSGVAEIDFFCGATLIVEGPAELDVESDWSVRVNRGRLRANVPPAARGFIVRAADSEIVDLGTEFALEVNADSARVEVIDGEVELRGGTHDGNHMLTGDRLWLRGAGDRPEAFEGLTTRSDVRRLRNDAVTRRVAAWQDEVSRIADDERLIAYYPMLDSNADRVLRNRSSFGVPRDGRLVGPVERVAGRFGPQSTGVEFSRPGARVRTLVEGEFRAFTFVCWVRIDSLENRYNALFMGDGYENGEPHWQIREDGRLMFSVMVDDTQDVRFRSQRDQRIVRDAGLHRVYYSEPFWDLSRSGQWFHLAAVYDPERRRVTHYANGKAIGSEPIVDKFHVTELRIGPAEIGNWGQPFRRTPWFAVRTLDGAIDELALFDAALSAGEIQTLYDQGKPPGY